MKILMILMSINVIVCGGDSPSTRALVGRPAYVNKVDRYDTTFYSDDSINVKSIMPFYEGKRNGCYKEFSIRGNLILTICYEADGYGSSCGCFTEVGDYADTTSYIIVTTPLGSRINFYED